jgi:hypothetical protein
MSEQYTLDFPPPRRRPIKFVGDDYSEERDKDRLQTQLDAVEAACRAGEWFILDDLCVQLQRSYPGRRFPPNSVSKQVRNLRKLGYAVERNYRGNGLYEYRARRSA